MDEMMKHMLRAMAWQRAKGELQSMLETYHKEPEKFEAMSKAIEAFVTEVEGEGWAE
jgi:hypothetical protein